MENRTQRILLTLLLLVSGGTTLAAERMLPLIPPDVKPEPVDESLIDTENFEFTAFAGLLSIEDFESSVLYGGRLTYHLSEDLFIEGSYGMAEGGKTSFEKLALAELISDSDRDYTYYSANVGWNVFPGEAFIGRRYAVNTNFYLTAGVGSTDFAGDSRFTVNFGAGFQALMFDFMALHFNVREHMFDIDVVGEKKTSINTEVSLGVSVFF